MSVSDLKKLYCTNPSKERQSTSKVYPPSLIPGYLYSSMKLIETLTFRGTRHNTAILILNQKGLVSQ